MYETHEIGQQKLLGGFDLDSSQAIPYHARLEVPAWSSTKPYGLGREGVAGMSEVENKDKRETDPTDQSDQGDRTDQSDQTDRTENRHQEKRLRPSGGYRKLRSFQVTSVIYDATVLFCDRFMDKRSRTVDQMVQAARSGRQNIAEGSRASAASSQTELRLINVARASLDELLLDFEDFLRQRDLPQWTKDDPRALEVRAVGKQDRTDQSDRTDPSDFL